MSAIAQRDNALSVLDSNLAQLSSLYKTDIQIEWLDGSGETVEIGYLNPNGQQCGGHCGVPGTDHVQYAYKTECIMCGYVYGTNGTDMFERRCPECQGGAPGIRYWNITKK
jgi:hypothetical protein